MSSLELERRITMPLLQGHKAHFETLLRAAGAGDLALMDCTQRKSGLPVPVLCAANRFDDGSIAFVPLAMLFDDNPYELVDPPQV
jgi:hypothetical protein